MKVLVSSRAENPYIELLYGSLQKQGVEVDYLKVNIQTLLLFPIIFLLKRLQGYHIFHVHWLNCSVKESYPFSRQISFMLSMYCLVSLKLTGFKVIWTVHNVVPHEPQTSNDAAVSRYLSRLATVKIVHSRYTLKQMKELGLDTQNTHVIPHGNYLGVYPDGISPTQARSNLHIKRDEFVILFFGLIRPYKGIDDLLSVFARLPQDKTRLVIVGKCTDAALRNEILAAQKAGQVDFYDAYVPDKNVATYFNACDVVCLPFKAITTSGSALLALSFGKSLVAPRTGALLDFPQTVGYLYDVRQATALETNLRQAVDEPVTVRAMGASAKAYAHSLSWDKIGAKTFKLYQATLCK
ncbi:MAG TPA: glycosyltransferase [Patescibacteria group bacterium]|nr:glycosyltransferase [Patescibacteria group bacterium]